jgi:glycosyltransferase involved in cell wall biosynthesis
VKKILIITYYWPPAAGPGVQRFLKTAKFLPEFGWKPYILTVKDGTYSSTDDSLENDIPEEAEVFKTKTKEPFKIYEKITGNKGSSKSVGMINLNNSKNPIKKLSLFIRANCFIPDPRKGWKKYAVKKAAELIKKEDISIVITTSPPHSTHLIGLSLQEKYNIKWIADFRDPWTNLYFNKMLPRTKRTIKKDKALENKVVSKADYITVISKGLQKEFKDRNSNIGLIYNGFDEDDIPKKINLNKDKCFKIAYVGNFKPNQNISAFWQAISELMQENHSLQDIIRIEFTGNTDNRVNAFVEKYQLEKNVIFNNYVKHHEATQIMSNSDLLLFVVPKAENNKLIITGKLFEYLATRNPILSIGPVDGNASSIINEAKRDKMLDYENLEAIKNTIKKYIDIWHQEPKKFKHNDDDIMNYSRKVLTKKLAEIFNKLYEN